MADEATGKSKMGCLKIAMIGGGILLALAVVGAIFGEPPAPTATSQDATDNQVAPNTVPETDEPQGPSLTGPQKNARRSAESYLQMKGFSRKGLIEQLSSDAGDGYDKADATAAVDSIDVNWDEQAARSAKDYLDMMGFSCDGLVDQLSSSAGDGFTKEEASYGAKQAGACG